MKKRKLLPLVFFTIFGVRPADAQVPTFSFEYKVDVAAVSTITKPGELSNAKTNPGKGCATEPLTHDARIWSAELTLRLTGLMHRPSGMYTDAANNMFYPVFTTNGKTLTLSSSRRDYSGSVSTNFAGELSLSFDALTLSELGDLIDIIENSQAAIGQAFAGSQVAVTLYRIQATAPGTPVMVDEVELALNRELGPGKRFGPVLEGLQTQRALSQGIDPFSHMPLRDINVRTAVVSRQDVSTAPTVQAGTVATARNDWKTVLRRDAFKNQTFVIDEPCLQFGLAPVLNDNKLLTGMDLKGRYDFLSLAGALYSKFRLEGQLPLSSLGNVFAQTASGASSDVTPAQKPYFQRLNITNATGYQRKAGDWIVSGGSLLTYSSTRNQGALDNHQWQAGGRIQVYAPNLTSVLATTLPGAGTSPIIFVDVAATHGSDPNDKNAHVTATGNVALTIRPSIRASVDLIGKIGKSPADAFGPYSHFSYGQAQMRFNLSKDWDYLLRYSCGRQDPDYHKFCGWQSGITLALGR